MDINKYRNAINQAIEDGVRFFFYRLPDTDVFSFGVQTDDMFVSSTGFKIVPFVEYSKTTAVKIYAEHSIDEYLRMGHIHGKFFQDGCQQTSTSYEDYLST